MTFRKTHDREKDRKVKLDKRGQGFVWGGLLVVLGVMMLLETFKARTTRTL